ncbi:MAG: DUF2058 domain-containing protein [Gammaproteobacteria bacterium]|nr:MAG: DUF2058 domain-containing protein [Gammaproteobacteria bacterium]RKZ43107.1 MAG: DUF2058 domain-containing protein [Gammaproteobacteria bacterium]RKZ77350.1 MAG: DUF2058 domain-containing protein [Gammaproteobacteria bacterium]
MSHSLQEQLLKSGLVSQDQAKKADKQAKLNTHQQQKQKKKRKKRSTPEPIDTESIAYIAAKAQEEEIERAKELNRQKEVQRLEKELQAQVRDLIQRHQVNDPKANVSYNFVEAGKFVKNFFVNDKQQQQLANGFLAITLLDDTYYLVPAPIAEKLLERVPETVVYLNKEKEKTSNEDDPYADYPIPDDLMW